MIQTVPVPLVASLLRLNVDSSGCGGPELSFKCSNDATKAPKEQTETGIFHKNSPDSTEVCAHVKQSFSPLIYSRSWSTSQ